VRCPTHRGSLGCLLIPQGLARASVGVIAVPWWTRTEMQGIQGWFLQRLGCSPLTRGKPGTTTLRLTRCDLLAAGQTSWWCFRRSESGARTDPIASIRACRRAVLAASQGVWFSCACWGFGYSPGQDPSGAAVRALMFWLRGSIQCQGHQR